MRASNRDVASMEHTEIHEAFLSSHGEVAQLTSKLNRLCCSVTVTARSMKPILNPNDDEPPAGVSESIRLAR